MAESVRDNRLVWGVVALGALVVASLVWIWGIGNSLSTVDRRGQQLEARLADTVSADAIAALEKRQAELEATIATLQVPDLGPVQQQVDDLKSEIAALQAQFTGLTVPGLDELVGRLSAVEASIDGIEVPDLAPVQTALAGLQTDVQGLRTQIGDFAPERVDDLTGRLETVARQVASLEALELPSLAGELDTLEGRLGSVEATVVEITSTGPDGLQGRLDALAARLGGISVPDIRPVETRLETAVADIETLKTNVAATATRDQVGVVEVRLADLGAQVNESDVGLATILTETVKLSTQIGELGAALATRADSAEVASLTDQLDALKEQVAVLPTTDASTFEADASTLRSDLDALEIRVAGLPPAAEIAELRTDLNELVDNPPSARPPQLLDRVYFGSSSTSVTADERIKIVAIAQKLAATPAALEIVGFSDSQGPAELNRSLSLRRAAAVRLALIEVGVDPAAVTSVTGLGEDAPPVDVGDDADEASNRVVLIYSRL